MDACSPVRGKFTSCGWVLSAFGKTLAFWGLLRDTEQHLTEIYAFL
jgi:hypothetical protein